MKTKLRRLCEQGLIDAVGKFKGKYGDFTVTTIANNLYIYDNQEAKKFIEDYGLFNAVSEVQDWDKYVLKKDSDYTDYSDYSDIYNALVDIVCESVYDNAAFDSMTFLDCVDNDTQATRDINDMIKEELGSALNIKV